VGAPSFAATSIHVFTRRTPFGAHARVRGGEVVANPGSTDAEPEVEGVPLQPDEVAIVGRIRITGEEVARQIHAVEAVPRAEVAYAEQVHALAGVLRVGLQQLHERERVQAWPEPRTPRSPPSAASVCAPSREPLSSTAARPAGRTAEVARNLRRESEDRMGQGYPSLERSVR